MFRKKDFKILSYSPCISMRNYQNKQTNFYINYFYMQYIVFFHIINMTILGKHIY